MATMHADELQIGEGLVRRLLNDQFPEWADLPIQVIEPSGTENAIFRLGEQFSVRLARRKGPTTPGGTEYDWLPRLAPLLPLEIPVPVAQGRPTGEYPGSGTSTRGFEATPSRWSRSMWSGRHAISPRSSARFSS